MDDKVTPYTPPPSVGHEIGVMFGFIGAFIVAMALYTVFWQVTNRREQRREAEKLRSRQELGVGTGEKRSANGLVGSEQENGVGA